MKQWISWLLLGAAMLLSSCIGTSRQPFLPTSGPPTVGMPAKLSERELVFAPELENSLRRYGMVPVRHGAGDMQLHFVMHEGLMRIRTIIEINDGRRTIARGRGSATGPPLFGRSGTAENSFQRALEQFEEQLSQSSVAGAFTAPTSENAGDLEVYH